MPKTVNQAGYAGKRNEILDAAQRLVETKGYEQMSIQDILNELGVSKGAFYHYFDSKAALLEALVQRLVAGVAQIVAQVAAQPELSALEKLNRFFAEVAQWKSRDKKLYLALIRVRYADDNALAREKIRMETARRIGPLFGEIVAQGIREQHFAPAYPARVGELMVLLIQEMNDAVARQLLASGAQGGAQENKEGNKEENIEGDEFGAIMETYAAYADLLERMLGVLPGSLAIVDAATLYTWLAARDAAP